MKKMVRIFAVSTTAVVLVVSSLIIYGFRIGKSSIIHELRTNDPKIQNLVYETENTNNHVEFVFQYDDAYFIPIMLEKYGPFYRWTKKSYNAQNQLEAISTDLGIKAFRLDSSYPNTLRFLNLSDYPNLHYHYLVMNDGSIDNLYLTDFNGTPLEAFEKSDCCFVFEGDKKGSYIKGNKNQFPISTDISMRPPSILNEIIDLEKETRYRFENGVEYLMVHDYMHSSEYSKLPIMQQGRLENPVLELKVNENRPILKGNLLKEYTEIDGEKTLTYYKLPKSYLLEVHEKYNDEHTYYELNSGTFQIVVDSLTRIVETNDSTA